MHELAVREGANATNVVAAWDEAHRYTPAPRHRRRLVVNQLRKLPGLHDCLDAGCGQPYLLAEVRDKLGLRCYGCDVSDAVMTDPHARAMADELRVLDIAHERWPDDRAFDVVVCSEVLEHVEDWRAALGNLVAMARRYVLITVPGGKRRPMDEIVGHHRHFTPPEIASALREEGCEPLIARRWGFPFHTLYRWAISRVGAERMYERYSAGHSYSRGQVVFGELLYRLFFVNDLFRSGDQVMVLARVGGA
jgi:hypothetical protein